MMPKSRKKTMIMVSIGLILIAALMIGLLSVSNLSEFFNHSGNIVVQIFEETGQGTVERFKVDLLPSSQAYQDIETQIKSNTYFVSPF